MLKKKELEIKKEFNKSKISSNVLKQKVITLIRKIKVKNPPAAIWKSEYLEYQRRMEMRQEKNQASQSKISNNIIDEIESISRKDFQNFLDINLRHPESRNAIQTFTEAGRVGVQMLTIPEMPEIMVMRYTQNFEEQQDAINVYELYSQNGILFAPKTCQKMYKMWNWSYQYEEEADLQRQAGNLDYNFLAQKISGRTSAWSASSTIKISKRNRKLHFVNSSLMLKFGQFERCILFASGQDRFTWLKGLRVYIRAIIKAQKRNQMAKPLFTSYQGTFEDNLKQLHFKSFNPLERLYLMQIEIIKEMSDFQSILVHFEEDKVRVHYTLKVQKKEDLQPNKIVVEKDQSVMADLLDQFEKIKCYPSSRGVLQLKVCPNVYGTIIKPVQLKVIKAKMQRWALLRKTKSINLINQMDIDNFDEEELINSRKQVFYKYSHIGSPGRKEEQEVEDVERSLTPVQQFKKHDFKMLKSSGILTLHSQINDNSQVQAILENQIDHYLKKIKKLLVNRNSFSNISPLTAVCDKLIQQNIYFRHREETQIKSFRRANKRRGYRNLKARRLAKKATIPKMLHQSTSLGKGKLVAANSNMTVEKAHHFSSQINLGSRSGGPMKYMTESMLSLPKQKGFEPSKVENYVENLKVKYITSGIKEEEEVKIEDGKRKSILRRINKNQEGLEMYEEDILVPRMKKRDDFCHYCLIF